MTLKKHDSKINGLPVLGNSDTMMDVIEKQSITDLIFAISGEMHTSLYSAILTAEEMGIEVTTMPVIYEELLGRVPISLLADDWVLRSFVDRAHASGSYELIKRLMDLLFAIVMFVFLILLFPIIALAIFIDDGLPILFRQMRVGKSGKLFNLYKFRSMRRDAEKDGIARFAVENDERATKMGKFLRKSHLDELPQLINVLRGDISLVGPRAERPELVETLEKKFLFIAPDYLLNLALRVGRKLIIDMHPILKRQLLNWNMIFITSCIAIFFWILLF